MTDDGDEGRLLIALSVLINGHTRTLRMVEAAYEHCSLIEAKLAKLNHKLDALYDLSLRNHTEMVRRIDSMQDKMFRNSQ